jgi:hypothetical protein
MDVTKQEKVKQFRKGQEDTNESLKKQAREFAKQIYSEHGDKGSTLDHIFKKAYKVAKKQGLSDEAFNYFMDFYEVIANKNTTPDDYFESSKIGEKIGTVHPSYAGIKGKFKVDDKDRPILKQMAEYAASSQNSQALAAYQCMTYRHPDNVIATNFVPGRDDPSCHVHPVLAALFLPKIPFLERRMLISNLAEMVTGLSKRQGPKTVADYEFLVDLGRDPNTHVCSGSSVMEDLKRRCEVQMMLRNVVHRFRNGQVYNCDFRQFMKLIFKCQMAPNDHPHLLFMRDEGVLMSRLMNIFSLRPVKIIEQTGAASVNGPNRLPFPFRPVQERGFVEVRLPYPRPGATPSGPAVNLMAGLAQPMWQIKGNFMVPQSQNIWFCQDVLIFYVNRRFPSLQWQQQAYTYTRLPTLVTGQDRCNTYPVKVEHVLNNVGGHQYNLQSVVVCNTDAYEPNGVTKSNVITGCSTIFNRWPTATTPLGGLVASSPPRHFWYDPLNALNVLDSTGATAASHTKPVTPLYKTRTAGYEGFDDLASTRGTIFVYTKAN